MICIYILLWMEETCEHVSVHCQQKYVPISTTNEQAMVGSCFAVVNFFMMTSWNGSFSALLAICAGNSPVPGEFPAQRPVTRSFDVFFDLRLNKRLSKQWWGWWFETPSCSLWRHHKHILLSAGTMTSNCVCVFSVYGEYCHAILNIHWELDYYLAANGTHINHTIFLIKKVMPYLIRKMNKKYNSYNEIFRF